MDIVDAQIHFGPGRIDETLAAMDALGIGAERIMWASDFSVNQRGESWADLLYGVLGDPDLTQSEREWVLGRSLRTWLDWPVNMESA